MLLHFGQFGGGTHADFLKRLAGERKMKFQPLELQGLFLIEPRVYEDPRGYFYEFYNEAEFERAGIRDHFVQDNHSLSSKGTLRGLHFQIEPKVQSKLIRVTRGKAFDVAVDIRKGSKTFGRHVAMTLDAAERKMLYIPAGFAHGFLVLEDGTEFQYKVSDFYSPEHERGIRWNDPDLKIRWPKLDTDYVFSKRDCEHPTFRQFFGSPPQ